jgi:CHAD domain-containing protein
MAKRWRIRPGKSLRENAQLIVPLMVDRFLSFKERVIGHPRLKQDLHRMRLAGKSLRYAMEVFEPGFPGEFSSCLESVKQLLDMMGSIHDCDVNIPRLQGYLKEIRVFNRLSRDTHSRISTVALTTLIREQSAQRRALFAQMSAHLEQWERDSFTNALLESMNSANLVKE